MSFPTLDRECEIKDDIVVGYGTASDGTRVFVKLAERGFLDMSTKDREAEFHVNRRVADMIETEDSSSSLISDYFLAAECHPRIFSLDWNNKDAESKTDGPPPSLMVWLEMLTAARGGVNIERRETWNVVFFVMRVLEQRSGAIPLSSWWENG